MRLTDTRLLKYIGGKSLWEGSLIVYQEVAGSTPVAIAANTTYRIGLLARSAASQAAGRRSILLCGTWNTTIEFEKCHSWRGSFCWQNRLVFAQEYAGSIPAHVTFFQNAERPESPNLNFQHQHRNTEVIRLDEETVLKAVGGQASFVGSSRTASA